MARQLVFDLSRDPCFDAEDFLVSSSNERAVADVRTWPHWPAHSLVLAGPAGAGKSHLASIWARDHSATVLRPGTPVSPELWDGGGRCVLIEDCDRAEIAEPDLFHTLNLARETRGWLMMTARGEPRNWGLETPDLVSRLRLATLAMLEAPDSELIKAVLIKLFADRQIAIDEDVVTYAARHCEQSLEAVNAFVAAVDETALASRRRITRPLAAATLSMLQTQGPT